jgi:dipeptidyl-peptidase 4
MKRILVLFLLGVFGTTFAQDELTVERVWKSGEFSQKGVEGFTSLSDGEHFTKLVREGGSNLLKKYSFKDFNGQGTTLLDLSTVQFNGQQLAIDDALMNKAGTMLLLQTGTEAIYRRSFSTVYYTYDLASKKTDLLYKTDAPQTLATFSPDGKQIAFVSANNLFVKNIATGKVTQLTSDGKQNAVINGTTDWVYEEEFAITQGFLWSPDSKYLAFMRFDESAVKEFSMAMYGELYPSDYTFKYPKAGEDNSKVTMHIVSAEGGAAQEVKLGAYEYIPRFQWSPVANELVVLTMNRHQNDLKYHLVTNPAAPADKVFYEETNQTYIDIDNNLTVLKDGKSILRTSEKDGFNHLYQLNFDGTQRQITTGSWDVIELYGINEKKGMIYYASAENGAINKTLYSITLDGKKKTAMSALTGTHNAQFSEGFLYYIRSSSSANTVTTYTLCDYKGKELMVLESNEGLQKKLDGMKLSKKEFIQIPGADGTMLNAWIMKPVNFDPNKKYPVYFNVYGGPGSNTVSDEFEGANYMYHQLLTQKGYIVVSVDPRGTMYRGEAFKKSTYLQLGKLETEDIIAAGKYMQQQAYVDAKRIGIQGWSYGGFMTALAMTKGADVFKMGISVAPVTNWRYYDNIYTERFMQTPAENASGYDDNSPVNHVSKLKGKLLVVHGSADDNVHFQNSMEFITAMVKANKQFDLFVYPNKNHGIYGGNTRNHLFTMMLDYTLENL